MLGTTFENKGARQRIRTDLYRVQTSQESPAFRREERQGQRGRQKNLRESVAYFYTFSYYMSNCVTVADDAEQVKGNMMGGAKNPYLKASDWSRQIDPDGLRWTSNKIVSRYPGTPIMVVENGFGAFDKVETDGSIHDVETD